MIDAMIRRRAAGLAALALSLPLFGAPALAQLPPMAQPPIVAITRSAGGALLSPEQREHYIKAFIAVDAGRWDEARRLAQRGNDPLANKLLRWLELQQPRSGFSFEDIAAFIDAHPDWPGQDILIRRAEEALVDRTDDSVVLAWFALRGPITVDGAMRYAEALMRNGERAKAVALIRKTWTTGAFGAKQEKSFTQRYRPYLGNDDHAARLSHLLWEKRYDEARRVMPLVDAGHRALADARTRLSKMSGGIDSALAKVPANLVNDPGLIYDRMRWRVRKKQEKAALETLLHPPTDLGRPDVWWNEREILARRAINDGRMSEAYRIVRDHRMTSGADLLEAEFLAGWIALRFTNDPKLALAHFTKLYDTARFPVTKARGAYWAGRAAAAAKDPATAQTWYKRAASFPVAYYGQLAAGQLDQA
jgi:soluble lytic murein transglycosylase